MVKQGRFVGRICGMLLSACLMVTPAIAANEPPLDAFQSMLDKGKSGQMLDEIEPWLKKQPDSFSLRYLKVVALMDLAFFEEAEGVLNGLIKNYPEVAALYNNRGVARTHLRRYSLAMQDFEEAIRLNSEYGMAHENLGRLHSVLAEMAFSRAMRLDRNNPALATRHALAKALVDGRELSAAPPADATPTTKITVETPVVESMKPEVLAPARQTQAVPINEAPPEAKKPLSREAAVLDSVRLWHKAWMQKDIRAYFSAYAPTFKPGVAARNVGEWRVEREKKITSRVEPIEVVMDNPKLTFREDGMAELRYDQTYRSGTLEIKDRKYLLMLRSGERWLIEAEKTLFPPGMTAPAQ